MTGKCQNERKKTENSSETKRIHQKVPYEQVQDICKGMTPQNYIMDGNEYELD